MPDQNVADESFFNSSSGCYHKTGEVSERLDIISIANPLPGRMVILEQSLGWIEGVPSPGFVKSLSYR